MVTLMEHGAMGFSLKLRVIGPLPSKSSPVNEINKTLWQLQLIWDTCYGEPEIQYGSIGQTSDIYLNRADK